MHLRTRTWALISLFCFLAAGYFWRLGNERARLQAPVGATNTTNALSAPRVELDSQHTGVPRFIQNQAGPVQTNAPHLAPPTTLLSPLLAYRLANTTAPLDELMRSDHAVLLRNALIDTSDPASLNIPPHLRAEGDPGSFVVQARGLLDDAFRDQLKAAGATIISYIPNNAYQVRVSAEGAARLRALPQTQNVLAWEPYYKLELQLLPVAVHQTQLPEGTRLNVLVFPGERETGLQAMKALGAEVLGEDRSPFGHQLFVQAPLDSLVALARLPIVNQIELRRARQPVNDLTRTRTGIATNTSTAPNHLGLSGQGVVVNMNDTGVEASHPDLAGRVFGPASFDPDGHGTHVAGTIISSGEHGPTGSNASGSVSNANFRGIATNASVFALPIDLLTGPLISDAYLQETAARTNVFISNNSWGYVGSFDYDLASASYDAAVRDALPGETGSRPLLYVFAAGNSGNGNSSGQGGLPNSIVSPGTAKNVITVGAIEKLRNITNAVAVNGETNQAFLPSTDSNNQVLDFSSRGNVGIGVEGVFGRFKPDLVAPGSFAVSCRSSTWVDPVVNTAATVNRINDLVLSPGQTNLQTIFIPGNARQLRIHTLPNGKSPAIFPPLSIYVNSTVPPNLTTDFVGTNDVTVPVTSGIWFYAIGNTNPFPVNYDLQTVVILTNPAPEYFAELKNLNDQLGQYRYESGTSQATPVVSGILALMQEMFEQRLSRTNSPALMKALLISGARSVGTLYNLQVHNGINYQGWGVVNLSNSVPAAMDSGVGTEATWPIAFLDESPTNALATGQSHLRTLRLPVRGQAYPLRITLVWTDPPGNPAASLKLVNDLDLIVTNKLTGEYYIGNNILQGSDFNARTSPTDTNPPPFDVVNNVENVFLKDPLSDSYDIVVRARRVNVNAVTAQTNGILQDYALVIASANSRISNAITSITPAVTVPAIAGYDPSASIRTLSNGLPLLDERVGANNPLLTVLNNGVTNQWNFYQFNNSFATNTNVAVVTFLAPNLSRTRFRDGDIDLYVSTDPGLTNLDAAVLAQCVANASPNFRSSRTRGGTELVVRPNAPTGPSATYYIGVKSEDQQAASFGLIAIATSQPFNNPDQNGNYSFNFFPARAQVPDGSPDDPNGVTMIAVVDASPEVMVRRIVLTNAVTHEQFGDLLGDFRHYNNFVVLNNHRSFDTPLIFSDIFIYDDSGEDDIPGTRHTDGPGSLRSFAGEPAFGVWTFTMIDNSPFHVGSVDGLTGLIEPENTTNFGNGAVVLTVQPQKWKYRTCDVPPGVTNMIVYVRESGVGGPLDLYVRFGGYPDTNIFDKYIRVDPPGGQLSIGLFDVPPLQPGRYYIGVFNPGSAPVTFTNGCELQYDLAPLRTTSYLSADTPMTLIDDALTNSIITVTNTDTLVDLKVGVRIDHPRLSDLVLHLVSPQGTRLLLAENRGGPLATNYGAGLPLTNVIPVSSSGGPTQDVRIITNSVNSGVIRIDYDFFTVPDDLRIYYEGDRIFDSGLRSSNGTFQVQFGPGTSTNITIIMNEGGNPNDVTVWQYTATVTGPWNYATFTESTNLAGPLKFSLPPYNTIPTTLVVLTNGFENALATNYSFMDPVFNNFENWNVVSNGVAVLANTDLALEGTNVLALSNGKVSLPMPNIVPDHDYLLSFAYRKVSSAPTQSVTITVPGSANLFRRLQFAKPPAGGADAAPALKVRLCPNQDITIRAATNCIVAGLICTGPEGETNKTFLGLPPFSLIGCWSHSSTILDSNTVAGMPFYIGTNTQFRAPPEPGDYYLFLGINDDDFGNSPTASSVRVTFLWQQCQWASAEASVGTTAIPLTGDFGWRTKRVRFTGNPTTTNLTLRADINSTMLFDALQVLEPVQSIFYLPEETLRPLQGELAQGDWKLEVWDNRAGPLLGTNSGALLSWALNFTFGNGPPSIALTNGFPYSNVVRRDEVRYFVVNVPREVTSVRNLLVSAPGDVELLYHRFGLPQGTSPPDDLGPLLQPVNLIVSTNTPMGAELRPGERYFLGVRNVNPNETNAFTLRATFNIPVVNLANGVPVRSIIPPNPNRSNNWNDSVVAVTNMQYFRFLVGANNGLSAAFTVTPLTVGRGVPGDVNLVLRRVLPVADHFPRPNFFDYESTATFTDPETIFVNANSLPIPLQAGAWYLGVYNMDTNNVGYEIRATFSTNSILFQTNDLVNGAVQRIAASHFSTNTVFYRLVADQTNSTGLFEICDLEADADLFLRRGDLPSPDLYDFSFLLQSSLDEPICLRTNIFLPDLNATNWFMAVVSRVPAIVPANLRGTVSNTNRCVACVGITLASPAPLPGGGIALAWSAVPGEYYVVDWSADLMNWNPVSVVTATTTTATYEDKAASSQSSAGFYRIRQVPPP